MRRERHRVRVPVAWLVSVLAHALLAGALAHLVRRPPDADGQASTPEPVEIEIGEAPAPESVTAEPEVEATTPHANRRANVVRERRAAAEPGVADLARGGEAGPESTDSGGAADVSPAGAAADSRSVDLSLGALPSATQEQLACSAADAGIRLPSLRRPSVGEVIANVERREDAVANVDKGRADPILYDYLRGARRRFEEEARRLAESIPLGAGDTVQSWKRGYLGRVDSITRGNAADPPGRRDLGLERRSLGDPPPTDVLSALGQGASIGSDGAERRTAEVCLDMAPGKTPTPSLRRESGNAALDRLILDSFGRSIAARPVPADVRTGLACYEVGISAFRVPPLPIAGCNFDSSGVRCIWPFKKVTSVTGKLTSVDYARGDTAAATPSLIRRPR